MSRRHVKLTGNALLFDLHQPYPGGIVSIPYGAMAGQRVWSILRGARHPDAGQKERSVRSALQVPDSPLGKGQPSTLKLKVLADAQ